MHNLRFPLWLTASLWLWLLAALTIGLCAAMTVQSVSEGVQQRRTIARALALREIANAIQAIPKLESGRDDPAAILQLLNARKLQDPYINRISILGEGRLVILDTDPSQIGRSGQDFVKIAQRDDLLAVYEDSKSRQFAYVLKLDPTINGPGQRWIAMTTVESHEEALRLLSQALSALVVVGAPLVALVLGLTVLAAARTMRRFHDDVLGEGADIATVAPMKGRPWTQTEYDPAFEPAQAAAQHLRAQTAAWQQAHRALDGLAGLR